MIIPALVALSRPLKEKQMDNTTPKFLQRLVGQVVELQAENERLKDFIQKKHPKHRHDHDYYHINCTLCGLEKIAYKEVSQALKGEPNE